MWMDECFKHNVGRHIWRKRKIYSCHRKFVECRAEVEKTSNIRRFQINLTEENIGADQAIFEGAA